MGDRRAVTDRKATKYRQATKTVTGWHRDRARAQLRQAGTVRVAGSRKPADPDLFAPGGVGSRAVLSRQRQRRLANTNTAGTPATGRSRIWERARPWPTARVPHAGHAATSTGVST